MNLLLHFRLPILKEIVDSIRPSAKLAGDAATASFSNAIPQFSAHLLQRTIAQWISRSTSSQPRLLLYKPRLYYYSLVYNGMLL